MFEALLVNTNMLELDLSGNSIQDDAMEWISEVILENSVLQKLNFEDNFFTDEAAKEMLKMLQKAEHLQLTELNLANNLTSDITNQQIDLFMRTHARELQKKKKDAKKAKR